tara:strand:- start:562 stop:861 length:300 start_codon:yes stop_codon:yes gene_type:complete
MKMIEILTDKQKAKILFCTVVVVCFIIQIIVFKAIEPDTIQERAESTQLLIDTFNQLLDKSTEQLAQCMSVVNSCNESTEQIDAQIKAIFEIRKEDVCD